MGMFPFMWSLLPLVAVPGPKRKPGRPRKRRAHTLLTAPPPAKRGRPRLYNPEEMLAIVEEWKRAHAPGGSASDAEALAHLLFEHAPARFRQRLQIHHEAALETMSPKRATRAAVLKVVGSRFRTLTALVARARAKRRLQK